MKVIVLGSGVIGVTSAWHLALAGHEVTVVDRQDSAGKDILTFAPSKDYQSLAFSSPDLVQGETYTIFTGGSSTGALNGSLYTGGAYTPGAEYSSFTVTTTVTTLGTGGGGGRRP